MKLEFKHIATYLPHKLKAISTNGNEVVIISWLCNFGAKHLLFTNLILNHEHWKPILRPLSDLTKPIEMNGERFVPIIEIIKTLSLFDLSQCTFESEHYTEEDGCYVNAQINGRVIDSIVFCGNIFECMNNDESFSIYNPQHEALDLLNKYHFDWKYNLIEAGLAVDINTLEK